MFCKIFTAAKTFLDVVTCKIKHFYSILRMFYFTRNHGLNAKSVCLISSLMHNNVFHYFRDLRQGNNNNFVVYYTAFCIGFPELGKNLYAFAQSSVAGGILFVSCSSVRASVCAPRNIVNMISCRVFDTLSPNLHQRYTIG